MPQLLDRLNQDHRHLARMLDLLDKLLDMFHDGQEPDYELICEMLEYFQDYADQVHHPSEDLMFERMKARGNRHAVIDVLMKQHAVLSDLTRYFRQSMEGIVHEEVLRRDQVEAQGRDLVQTLRNHLNLEETEAFPLAKAVLTDEDWESLAQDVAKVTDPVFEDLDPARFRALYDYLMQQTQP